MASSSQDSLASFFPQPDVSEPATPQPAHTTLPVATTAAVSKAQSSRVENTTTDLTPPPSSQIVSSSQTKARTPTPTFSHISTPPPTVEASQFARLSAGAVVVTLTSDEIATASTEELRAKVAELQASFQEAKMSAAHHRLQYQMLSQESAASIERMAVEARMAQYENDVLHNAEHARTTGAPGVQEGMIPVQKDLYQRMCSEIQRLTNANTWFEHELFRQQKTITLQENEISTLDDKVTLLRDRIRENRDHLNKYRRVSGASHFDQNQPHSVFATPRRQHHPYRATNQDESTQPFAALLQASEMASQAAAARRPSAAGKKAHMRNTHSLSSLPPVTPQRQPHAHKQLHDSAADAHSMYYTPQIRHNATMKFPSTAPQPRTSAMRTTPPDLYSRSPLAGLSSAAASARRNVHGPGSDGTLSASENEAADSEAETDIISPSAAGDDHDLVRDSQASLAAAQMLRSSESLQAQRRSFMGSGMLESSGSTEASGKKGDRQAGAGMKQTKLYGAVRKRSSSMMEDEEKEPAAKRHQAVGLGIAGIAQE